MKTLKFKLYPSQRNRHLKRSINAAGVIYNHCIALHRRYYRMWGKHIPCARLQKHIAKKRKRNPFWQLVGSQAVQDICQRIERAYQLFFKHHKKGVNWYPSTKTCSCCGHVLDELDLDIRRWRCPSCHQVNDRDENAALNIKRVGSSTLGVGDVRQALPAISVVKPESHKLNSWEWLNEIFASVWRNALKGCSLSSKRVFIKQK